MITLKNMFLENIDKFLKTLCIKNDYFAEYIKEDYMFQYQLSALDDINNPYYLNICGEYSPHQTPIRIQSLDTGDIIQLTKRNLYDHPKTKFAYTITSSRYDSLCEMYPDQISLITSVLYPAIKQCLLPYTNETKKLMRELIAKPNFTLLSYDDNVLYTNEKHSIIERIESILNMVRVRYDVKEFKYEYFYPHVLWSNIISILYQAILTQRICNLRTANVIPSQIWEYLKSKGLSDYQGFLSKSQEHFLYRNMHYILQNKGKQSNLELLHDGILKEMAISLYGKTSVQNSSGAKDNCRPLPEIISENITEFETPIHSLIYGMETIKEIVEKEYNDGLEPDKSDVVINKQTDILGKASQTYLSTKLIELKKSPIFGRWVNLHFRYMVDTMISLISHDKLNYNIIVNTPDDNISLLLSVKEAFALMYYCVKRIALQRVFLTKDNIEKFYGKHVYYKGKLFVLTKENGSKYLDQYVDIRDPIYIPSEAYINFAFKENLDKKMVPSTFEYKGRYYYVQKYFEKYNNGTVNVDELQDVIDSFKNPYQQISSNDELIKYLGKTLGSLIQYYEQMYAKTDRIEHESREFVRRRLMNMSKVSFDLVNGLTKYEEWFDRYIDLKRAITTMNVHKSPKVIFNKFLEAIVAAILGHSAIVDRLSTVNEEKYQKLKQLLTQLCSYTVAFLTSDSNVDDVWVSKYGKMFMPFITEGEHNTYSLCPHWKRLIKSESTITHKISPHIEFCPNYFVTEDIRTYIFQRGEFFITNGDTIGHTYMTDNYQTNFEAEEPNYIIDKGEI